MKSGGKENYICKRKLRGKFCAPFLILTMVLSGCGVEVEPTPTVTPISSETVFIPEDSYPPSEECYFPRASSELFEMEPLHAALFDGITNYYAVDDYPRSFMLPTFVVMGKYEVSDTQTVYIISAKMWSFGAYSVEERSVDYGVMVPRFKILIEAVDGTYSAISTEEIWDGNLLEECKPIPELYAELLGGEPTEPLWVSPPMWEVFELYRKASPYAIDYIIDWADKKIPVEDFWSK